MSCKTRILLSAFGLLFTIVSPATVLGHSASDSYLRLSAGAESMTGRWDIAIRDLEYAIGLDEDGDGVVTWGELRTRRDAIAAYALARLQVNAGETRCSARASDLQVDRHSDGVYAVLGLTFNCPGNDAVAVRYDFLFDLDPLHRGLASYTRSGRVETVVFSPVSRDHAFGVAGAAVAWQQAAAYLREGVWHIWTGYDHLLFLLLLLLPSVLLHRAAQWRPVEKLAPAVWQVVRIVTAFTLAHSITLTLAVLGVVTLPTRLVESAIAASIVFVAIANLAPRLRFDRSWVAAVFGLVHGLGFAGALQALELPSAAGVYALAGFDAGVELGQLVIVAVFFPIAFALRGTWLYPRIVMRWGSMAVGLLAGIWLLERGFGLDVAALAQRR